MRGPARESLHDHLLDVARDDDRGTGRIDAHEPARMLRRELLEPGLDGGVECLGCDLEAIERELLGALPLRRRRGGYRQVEGQIGPDVAACGGVQAEQILGGIPLPPPW